MDTTRTKIQCTRTTRRRMRRSQRLVVLDPDHCFRDSRDPSQCQHIPRATQDRTEAAQRMMPAELPPVWPRSRRVMFWTTRQGQAIHRQSMRSCPATRESLARPSTSSSQLLISPSAGNSYRDTPPWEERTDTRGDRRLVAQFQVEAMHDTEVNPVPFKPHQASEP